MSLSYNQNQSLSSLSYMNIASNPKEIFKKQITPNLLLFLVRFNFIGMMIFLGYSFLKHHYHPNLSYPHATFLGPFYDRFMDFFNVNFFVQNRDPYGSTNTSYPPFALAIAYLFSFFDDHTVISTAVEKLRDCKVGHWEYFSFISSFLVFLFITLYRSIYLNTPFNRVKASFFTIALLFSYPILFLIDRGNYLVYSFIFLTLFVLNYESNKGRSSLFLGLAIALKIYPAFFLLLFFIDKKYKHVVLTILVSFSVSLLSLLFFKGEIFSNIAHFIHNCLVFSNGNQANALQIVSWSSSLNAICKIPFLFKGYLHDLPRLSNVLFYVIAFLTIPFLIKALIKDNVYWRKIFILTIAMILFMPISPDYFLVYLYLPLILLVRSEIKLLTLQDKYFLLVLGLLLVPKTYWVLMHSGDYVITLQNLINPLLMYLALIFYSFSFVRQSEPQKIQTTESLMKC